MMAICEDAPCCGCCGPEVWAAEARAMEDRGRDWDEEAWIRQEIEAEEAIELAISEGRCCRMGDWVRRDGRWRCEHCGEAVAWEGAMATFRGSREQDRQIYLARFAKHRDRALRRGTLRV